MSESKLDAGAATRCVNTIRTLSADVVCKANSGHPGAPMGMAPMAVALFMKHMRFSAKKPGWWSRDRFVLSNGHASALLYTLLHLCGYAVPMEQLKQFRQLHSMTPGHPESTDTPGVEVTTGPLGQGIANATGLAIAERHLAATFNKPGFEVFDNFTYVFCGDGCLQEGVAAEASSLAGHLGLGRLIVLYDDNRITIDGETSKSFSEDVLKRYEAYGWHTSSVKKGDDDVDGIAAAIAAAKRVKDRPSIISVRTTIGFGSKKQDTAGVHGSPLSAEDLASVKSKFGFDPKQFFHVPDDVRRAFAAVEARGAAAEAAWNKMFAEYSAKYPALAKEAKRRLDGGGALPDGWEKALPRYDGDKAKAEASRSLSGACLNALAGVMPELVGGSADLTGSNKTALKGAKAFQKDCHEGRYFYFGVREHGMAAVGNGMAAYGGLIPFTATFLNFIEYCFPAVRLSAMAEHQQIYVMTHDSIGLGEDGPTHQPIEALTLCRATPNIYTFRPADGNETAGCYLAAIKHRRGPSVLALSRQNLPALARSSHEAVARGGYVVYGDEAKRPGLILIATGSEVAMALDAAKIIEGASEGKTAVRVVSMPCTELFDEQPVAYRRQILTPSVPVVSVEAAATTGWHRYAHECVGMTTFGASAPIAHLYKEFGLDGNGIAATVKKFLADAAAQAKECGVGVAFGLLPAHIDSQKPRKKRH